MNISSIPYYLPKWWLKDLQVLIFSYSFYKLINIYFDFKYTSYEFLK